VTVKPVSSIHHFVCGSTDTKSEIIAPAGSRLYEFTTGTPDTVQEYITFGGGVWGKLVKSVESSTA
jgi:hypothetical protein